MAAGFYAGLFVVGVILFYCYAKIGKLLRCILFTAVTGITALLLLTLAGNAWGMELVTITPLSALVSAILGIPGILAMLIMNLL